MLLQLLKSPDYRDSERGGRARIMKNAEKKFSKPHRRSDACWKNLEEPRRGLQLTSLGA